MKSWKKYLAEFFGTMVLVVFACGVAQKTGCNGASFDVSYLMTAAAFGLVIVAMAYSVGNVSGCHINPAVSIAMLVSKKMSFKDFVGYVIAQFAGAIAGAAVLGVLFGFEPTNGFGCNGLFNGSIALSIVAEIILTGVFVFAILGVTSKPEYGRVAGLVIGGTLTPVHLLGIALAGTSVNPARSFGPALMALISGNAAPMSCVWVFIVAPLVGGVLAALAWAIVKPADEEA